MSPRSRRARNAGASLLRRLLLSRLRTPTEAWLARCLGLVETTPRGEAWRLLEAFDVTALGSLSKVT